MTSRQGKNELNFALWARACSCWVAALAERLVTDRPPYLMRAADGTFVEVFEWKSAAAIEAAHGNSAVQAMWARFEDACTYESLLNLKETKDMFTNFEAVDL